MRNKLFPGKQIKIFVLLISFALHSTDLIKINHLEVKIAFFFLFS